MKSEQELRERLKGIGGPTNHDYSPDADYEPQKRAKEIDTLQTILDIPAPDRERVIMETIGDLAHTAFLCDMRVGPWSKALHEVKEEVYRWAGEVPDWLTICNCGKARPESNDDWPYASYCPECEPETLKEMRESDSGHKRPNHQEGDDE